MDDELPVAEALQEVALKLEQVAGAVVIRSSRLQLSGAALDDLSTQRPGGSVALVSSESNADGIGEKDVRVLHHRVVDVVTNKHRCSNCNSVAVGLIRLSANDRVRAATAVRDALAVAPADAESGYAFQWLILVLTRVGIRLKAEPVEPWEWSWAHPVVEPTTAGAAQIKLNRANRADDGLYSVAVLRKLSKPVSALGYARGWSPNSITLTSLLVGLMAAVCFALGDRWAMVLGAILLQVSIVIDCADGEVARLSGRYSAAGAWLDAATDRVKEYAAYAGLAAGAWSNGVEIWWLAGAVMVLQTARHMSDYTFHQVQVERETVNVVRPLDDVEDLGEQYSGIIAKASGLNQNSFLLSVKKAIFFPIGERWLVISVGAAFLTPWWTFVLLLGFGVLSAMYALAGRLLRTRSWPLNPAGFDVVAPQADAGFIALALKRFPPTQLAMLTLLIGLVAWLAAAFLMSSWIAGLLLLVVAVTVPGSMVRLAGQRYSWLLPSAVAGFELALWLVAAATLAIDLSPWGYAIAAVIAFHRYDLLYRAIAGQPASDFVRISCGGTDGRTALLGILILTGGTVFAHALPWVFVVFFMTSVVFASTQWLRQVAREVG